MGSAIHNSGGGGGSGSTPVQDATSSQKGVVKLAGDLAGTADSPTVPSLANKAEISGGAAINYLGDTVPAGTLEADWTQVGGVYAGPGSKLWFKRQQVAQPPATQPPPPTPNNQDDLLLTAQGFDAEFVGTDGAVKDNGSPNATSSRAIADALTLAVLERDQTTYDHVLAYAKAHLRRDVTGSGQTQATKLFGSAYNITTSTVTSWTVNSGDNLTMLGAAIRAWNLWGRTSDRDFGSELATDIKTYLVNTDEGMAYLAYDETQKAIGNGHHNFNSGNWWIMHIGGMKPHIYRMAKTFTGDVVFDQLVAGYYSLLAKATANSGPIATTTGLVPDYVGYDTASHLPSAVTNGQNGWTITLSSDFSVVSARVFAACYADYRLFSEGRALAYLQGAAKTFLTSTYASAGKLVEGYNRSTAATTSSNETVVMYQRAVLALLANDATNSTAAAIKANKLPATLASDSFGKYFSNGIQGVTPTPARDPNLYIWLDKATESALYLDLAIMGSNPNAGTTTPPATGGGTTGGGTTGGGTTGGGTTGGGGTSTTPPPSTGAGIALASWFSNGAAPSGLTQTQRYTLARGEYDKFNNLCFVNYNCNPDGTSHVTLTNGMWRVMNPTDQFNNNQSGLRATVSEGIGYGMLATVFFGNPNLPSGVYDSTAQTMFDGFWKYYKNYMNANGLMHWCITSNGVVNGQNGATDADQDVALALVIAHRQWGSTGAINYGAEASALIAAIRNKEFVPETGYTAPNAMTNGDAWGFDNPTYFADYFHPVAYREFYMHTGDQRWLRIIAANYPIAQGTFYNTGKQTSNLNGLITDITRDGNRAGAPILGYNDVRYPWRVTWDFLVNGSNTDALAYLAPKRMVDRAKVVYGTDPVAASPTGDGVYNPYSGTSGIVAEPAIDYSYWNGNYRNATYVQAYGVPALVDAAHSAWAAACLSWLGTDTEANYFGRGLSCMSTMLMAAIAQLGTPTSPGSTTTTPPPVVVPPPPTNTPAGTLDLYADPTSNLAAWASGLSAGAKKTRGLWAAGIPQAFWSGIDWDPDAAFAKTYIDAAVAAGKVPQVLSYSIPARDLGQFSSGGAANRTAYETWLGKLAAAIGNKRVILEYEPDSLTQADGLSADARTGRISMMTWGIQTLKSQCPNVLLYVDIGHSAWKTVDQAVSLLQEVHVENANGFCVNVSNFRPDAETITYGQAICGKLNLPNARFMFDSGRNGNPNIPSWRWANPADTRFGRLPQWGNTGIDKCDGWTWFKRVGESDGNSGDGAPAAGTFWPTYMYNDSVGDNIGTDPNNDLVSATSGLLQRPPTPGVSVTG